MPTVPFALFDAFSDTAFNGSPAGIVTDAAGFDTNLMQRIAKEIGAPATCFVTAASAKSISARFLSTVKELPMCGHGTICLMTRMIELGVLQWNGAGPINVELCLPDTTAVVEIFRRKDARALVMLDVRPPAFRCDALDTKKLAGLLGIEKTDYRQDLPIEIASADFVHLVVPVTGLAVMHRINPDFAGLTRFCHDNGVETVAVFCTQTEQLDHNIHVRDFCPAVGVAESAAAGTTNAALTSYLIRHELLHENGVGTIAVQAEQGREIGRPSSIRSLVHMNNGAITRLQVGGVATKVIDGNLHVPLVPR